MNRIIRKYQIRWGEGQREKITVPCGSELLGAEMQVGDNTEYEKLWVFFEEDVGSCVHDVRTFVYYYTGTPIGYKNVQYIRSVKHNKIIYHLYEIFS